MNEDAGFGVRHIVKPIHGDVVPYDNHTITVKFPRKRTMIIIKEVGHEVTDLFPKVLRDHPHVVSFYLQEGSHVTVNGFGTPFENYEYPYIEALVSGDMPISDHVTLPDVLQQRQFHLFVDQSKGSLERVLWLDTPPAGLRYPYGVDHSWDVVRYKEQSRKLKSATAFPAAYSFQDDNEHITAVTQSAVQDVFWLQEAANQIAAKRQPAYFVPVSDNRTDNRTDLETRYIIFLHEGIPSAFQNGWRRLTKESQLRVELWDWEDHEDPIAKWDCELVRRPESITELHDHPIDPARELVLAVRFPPDDPNAPSYGIATFPNHVQAQDALAISRDAWSCVALRFGDQLADCERRVNAVGLFTANANPSNPRACGLLEPDEMSTEARDLKLAEIEDRMELHRMLLRGNGFYEWMTRFDAPTVTVDPMKIATSFEASSTIRPLPTADFTDSDDYELTDALIDELLPSDRNRFRQYLSRRPLGLGLITAGPGYGKTSVIAAAAAIMQVKFGHILCSGPTNVAVSNFAERIHRITISACARCNKRRAPTDLFRKRHRLVVRAYKDSDEIDAVMFLLQHPRDGDKAIEKNRPRSFSKWKLELSLAYWILALLRSRAKGIRQLDDDDSRGLRDLRRKIDDSKDMANLRAVATGRMTWQKYQSLKDDPMEKIYRIYKDLIPLIDILCTTPAMTVNVRHFARWKAEKAQGIAIDEAANMHRADLYCVWGNTLLPCFLGGDPNQLAPAVLTQSEKDSEGNLLNRFASTGKISALETFRASGIPVFRMRVQLRMAEGLFDTVSQTIYDTPAKYHEFCKIDNAKFAAGRTLEAYITNKYPDVSPAEEGKLSPLFIHCQGTRVSVDPATGSKKSFDQVTVALDFVSNLVRSTRIKGSQVIILAPYSANVELIQKLMKQHKYATVLKDMDPPSTIDGYQGQERDIVVVVMGTRAGSPGPGFTSDKQRLNVLLTRQRCGLVVVGDIDAAGPMDQFRRGQPIQAKGGQPAPPTPPARMKALHAVYKAMCQSGRVATVKVNEGETMASP